MKLFIQIHVAISLIGILSGLVVLFGMLTARALERWTLVFLSSTAATSITGFLFPFHGFTPAIGVGTISVLILVLAVVARYPKHLSGNWRWIYVITAMLALYFNVFVLIVQLFQNVPSFKALAPTQSEPPFLLTQLLTLLVFVVLTVGAVLRFRLLR